MIDEYLPAPPLAPPVARADTADPGAGAFDGQLFERLLKERIVFLGTEVTDVVANRICAQLLLLAAEDGRRDISLYINSPGGSVDAGMAIYDTMQFVPNDVSTLAVGFAASMGQFLLCSGTAGKRYSLPHARIMMHQPSGGMGGTASDIAIQAEQLILAKQAIQERISFHSGQSAAQIQADSDRDKFFTAEQAREYGLIDRVLTTATGVLGG
jgi:ATP-dependent Clp protease protease subunit